MLYTIIQVNWTLIANAISKERPKDGIIRAIGSVLRDDYNATFVSISNQYVIFKDNAEAMVQFMMRFSNAIDGSNHFDESLIAVHQSKYRRYYPSTATEIVSAIGGLSRSQHQIFIFESMALRDQFVQNYDLD